MNLLPRLDIEAIADGAIVRLVRGPRLSDRVRLGPNEVHFGVIHADGSYDDCGVSKNLLTNIGRDWLAGAMGGFIPAGGAGSPATATSATTVTATATVTVTAVTMTPIVPGAPVIMTVSTPGTFTSTVNGAVVTTKTWTATGGSIVAATGVWTPPGFALSGELGRPFDFAQDQAPLWRPRAGL